MKPDAGGKSPDALAAEAGHDAPTAWLDATGETHVDSAWRDLRPAAARDACRALFVLGLRQPWLAEAMCLALTLTVAVTWAWMTLALPLRADSKQQRMLAVWTVVMEDCMTWSYALDLDHGLPMEMLCGPWMTLDLTLLDNTHGVTWATMELPSAGRKHCHHNPKP